MAIRIDSHTPDGGVAVLVQAELRSFGMPVDETLSHREDFLCLSLAKRQSS